MGIPRRIPTFIYFESDSFAQSGRLQLEQEKQNENFSCAADRLEIHRYWAIFTANLNSFFNSSSALVKSEKLPVSTRNLAFFRCAKSLPRGGCSSFIPIYLDFQRKLKSENLRTKLPLPGRSEFPESTLVFTSEVSENATLVAGGSTAGTAPNRGISLCILFLSFEIIQFSFLNFLILFDVSIHTKSGN